MKNPISKFKKLIVAGTLFVVAGTLVAQAAGTQFSEFSENSEISEKIVAGTQNAKKAPKPKGFKKTLLGTKFLLNPNIKKNAKFYIVLCSASWCGMCRAEIPKVIKIYDEKIKDNSALELVLLSFDAEGAVPNPKPAETMKAWAEKEEMKFPIALNGGAGTIFGSETPTPQGLPMLYIFNPTGKLLKSGRPMKVLAELETICK